MSVRELLRKKRDGEELTKTELEYFVQEMVNGNVAESQIGAMLMAMYLRGLSNMETTHLTKCMVLSGEQLEWQGVMVDKHSTGGVGDKISLILAPVLAACHLKVPMVSGRSMEHTGGTLDKLESIPGYTVDLSKERMEKALENAGCFIAAATSLICPADKMMYRVRDITSTVDNINLIASSIISKKVASGVKFLVIDVKVGKAAFCKTVQMARDLSDQLISVARELGVQTRVVLTRMDEPLGSTAGNSLEVAESVQCLSGNMSPDIRQLVSILAVNLLEMTGYEGDAAQLVDKVVADGSAMDRFRQMLLMQGVSEETVSGLVGGGSVLPTAKYATELRAHSSGWVSGVDAMVVGQVCWALGAGRMTDKTTIDSTVGTVLTKHIGDSVKQGEVWLTVHHSSPALAADILEQLDRAFTVSSEVVKKPDIILEVIQ